MINASDSNNNPSLREGHRVGSPLEGHRVGRKLRTIEMNRISVEEFREAEKIPLVVVLDDVRSMYNIGSVFRTCDAFRVEAIYLCGITACPPHQEIHKTALGAEDSVSWRYFKTAGEAVEQLHRDGYFVWSVEQCEGSVKLQNLTHPLSPSRRDGELDTAQAGNQNPSLREGLRVGSPLEGHRVGSPLEGHRLGLSAGVAVILGNEVKGVHQEVIDRSDGCLEIPQFGTKHSMNVSVTAGIVIWEFARQFLFSAE